MISVYHVFFFGVGVFLFSPLLGLKGFCSVYVGLSASFRVVWWAKDSCYLKFVFYIPVVFEMCFWRWLWMYQLQIQYHYFFGFSLIRPERFWLIMYPLNCLISCPLRKEGWLSKCFLAQRACSGIITAFKFYFRSSFGILTHLECFFLCNEKLIQANGKHFCQSIFSTF